MNTRQTLREIHSRLSGKLSDKWDLYLEVYEDLLSAYRDRTVNILEVRVQNGGSLETWGTYFEKAENIIGCDINPKCEYLHFSDKRIRVVVGDATKSETVDEISRLVDSFDLVIEDGSHTSHDIITTFAEFFPRIRPGGLYIAEDLHCCYWEEWGGGLSYPYSGIEYFKALCDCINESHWNRKDITPEEYINNIGRHHNAIIDTQLLKSIASISFYDSICVIRRIDESSSFRLSERIIGGVEESVVAGHKEIALFMPTHSQNESRLTGLVSYADEIALLAEQKATLLVENDRLLARICEIESSSSWRLTEPLRLAAKALKSLSRLIRNVMERRS